jgi:hypothetical protein
LLVAQLGQANGIAQCGRLKHVKRPTARQGGGQLRLPMITRYHDERCALVAACLGKRRIVGKKLHESLKIAALDCFYGLFDGGHGWRLALKMGAFF